MSNYEGKLSSVKGISHPGLAMDLRRQTGLDTNVAMGILEKTKQIANYIKDGDFDRKSCENDFPNGLGSDLSVDVAYDVYKLLNPELTEDDKNKLNVNYVSEKVIEILADSYNNSFK